MALTKMNVVTNNISNLQDLPNDDDGLGPEQLKAKYDQFGIDCKDYINNTLTVELDTNFATKTELANVVTGQIPNGTISIAKLDFDPATQTELDNLAGTGRTTETVKGVSDSLATHKSSDDHDGRYYTETESDNKYVAKSILTTSGDIPFATASGVWSRIAKGSANQKLSVNSSGTGFTYVDDINYVAGSTITILSAPTERSTNVIGDTAMKYFRIKQSGSYRVSCQIKNGQNTGSNLAYGKVYVNGVQAIQWSSIYNATYATLTYDTGVIPANSNIYITLYTNDVARPAWIKNATITVDNITTDPQVVQD